MILTYLFARLCCIFHAANEARTLAYGFVYFGTVANSVTVAAYWLFVLPLRKPFILLRFMLVKYGLAWEKMK